MRDNLQKALDNYAGNFSTEQSPNPGFGSTPDFGPVPAGIGNPDELLRLIKEKTGHDISQEELVRYMDQMGIISEEVKRATAGLHLVIESHKQEGQPGAPRIMIMQTKRKSDGATVAVICQSESDGGTMELIPMFQLVTDLEEYEIPEDAEIKFRDKG